MPPFTGVAVKVTVEVEQTLFWFAVKLTEGVTKDPIEILVERNPELPKEQDE